MYIFSIFIFILLKIIYDYYINYNFKVNKVNYYFYNFIFNYLIIINSYNDILKNISKYDINYIKKRVNYYNKINSNFKLKRKYISNKHMCTNYKDILKYTKKFSVYTLDFIDVSKHFYIKNLISINFGDVREISKQPTYTKSRLISNKNKNNIILKLEKLRHFNFIDDPYLFHNKLNKIVWRGGIYQLNRKVFKKKYKSNNLINIDNNYLSIREQLKYKFILSLEGNDVATNLKWIMSSNSVCVMPKPTCETWFMEGLLIPNYHYIEINSDYSNLEEKIKYYLNRNDLCLKIIKNANEYCEQFKDLKREKIISLLVMKNYLDYNMS
jgi:hypothetical protein